MITTAHEKQYNVILDFVAHHIHTDHPLYKQHPEWVTPLYLPDGSMNTERWDDHRLTTWFDTFLPTFDFARPEVIQALSDTALFWVKKYPIDGFRHDATKHIHTEFWRELTFKIKQERKKLDNLNLNVIRKTGSNILEEDLQFFYQCYCNTYAIHKSTPYLTYDFFYEIYKKISNK